MLIRLPCRGLPDIRGGYTPGGLELAVSRSALEADKPAVAKVMGGLEYPVVVDLSGARLMPSWMVGELQVADLVPPFFQATA